MKRRALKEKKDEKIDREKNLEKNIEKEVKKVIEKQKRDQVEDQKAITEIQAELATTQANLAKTAEESFESIKSGSFEIKEEANFKPENLKIIDGVQFELQKHDLAIQQFQAEMGIMEQGMIIMTDKQTEFEDKKSDILSGRNLGKLAGIGSGVGLAAGGAVLAGAAFWPATLAVAGAVGVATIAKNLVGAAYRRFGNPSPDSWLAHGSILGAITGENDEAYALQKEKLDFETQYDEYSGKLKIKKERLEKEGEDIYGKVDDPQEILDNQAINAVKNSKIRENLENLYKEIGLEVDENKVNTKIDDLKEKIRRGDPAKLAKLKTDGDSSKQLATATLEPGVAYLEQSESQLDHMEFKAADVWYSTLGFVGKNLQKGVFRR